MDASSVLIALDALEDSNDPRVLAWAVIVLEVFDSRLPFKAPSRIDWVGSDWFRWAQHSIPYVLDGLVTRDVL